VRIVRCFVSKLTHGERERKIEIYFFVDLFVVVSHFEIIRA